MLRLNLILVRFFIFLSESIFLMCVVFFCNIIRFSLRVRKQGRRAIAFYSNSLCRCEGCSNEMKWINLFCIWSSSLNLRTKKFHFGKLTWVEWWMRLVQLWPARLREAPLDHFGVHQNGNTLSGVGMEKLIMQSCRNKKTKREANFNKNRRYNSDL